jgi:hypothetical protein
MTCGTDQSTANSSFGVANTCQLSLSLRDFVVKQATERWKAERMATDTGETPLPPRVHFDWALPAGADR